MIAWLYSAMSLSPNRALPIVRYFDPIVTHKKQEICNPSAVGVCLLIRCRDGYLISVISPKWSGQ